MLFFRLVSFKMPATVEVDVGTLPKKGRVALSFKDLLENKNINLKPTHKSTAKMYVEGYTTKLLLAK